MESVMGGSSREMGIGSLIAFFVLAFAFTWGVCAAMIFLRAEVEALAGPISGYNPVFILAVWGPAFAALILITWRYGLKGLGAFLRRLTLWRMHWGWWAFLIFSIPAARYFGAALNGTLSEPFPFSPWQDVIPILLLTLIIGPVEEFGWRGFALPLLQRKMAPFWATLILGAIWGLWHYPAFIIPGTPQVGGDFGTFIIAAIVISFLFTALFNASRGSILMPVLYHFQANNPAMPDGGAGWVIAMLVFVVVIVWLTRDKMFRRDGGETELLLARGQTRQDSA
jgi:membrane protease YdiL (CAAX protease family)